MLFLSYPILCTEHGTVLCNDVRSFFSLFYDPSPCLALKFNRKTLLRNKCSPVYFTVMTKKFNHFVEWFVERSPIQVLTRRPYVA